MKVPREAITWKHFRHRPVWSLRVVAGQQRQEGNVVTAKRAVIEDPRPSSKKLP